MALGGLKPYVVSVGDMREADSGAKEAGAGVGHPLFRRSKNV
jgi:hypothetical protein